MTNLFETTSKNPLFSNKGNCNRGIVMRSGWKPANVTKDQAKAIQNALSNANVDQVYRKGRCVYAFMLNGTETKIF